MDDYYITKRESYEALRDKLAYSVRGPLLPSQAHLIAKIISDIPAADVAPVVHAQWEIPIFIDGNDALDPRVKCSECGEVEAALARWKYCPNCGARMDGGENYG